MVCLSLMAVAVPCLPLIPFDGIMWDFWQEWGPFHLLVTDYFSETFRQRMEFPVWLNTERFAGMAHPVFYGTLLYPVLGAIGSATGGAVAIRLLAGAVFMAQFALVASAVARLGGGRFMGFTAACLVIWAAYPLTNLYNRSAVTEFFGTAFFTCAISAWFLFIKSGQWRWLNLAVFFFAAMAGAHPITSLFAASVFWWVFILSFLPPSNLPFFRGLWKAAGSALACILCLAPWLYAVHDLGGALDIANRESLIYYFTFDSLKSRLMPFPFDARSISGAVNAIRVPHWDTQLNVPLLGLFAATAVFAFRSSRREKWTSLSIVSSVSMLSFAFFLWISVNPHSQSFTPDVFNMVQYASRLVSFQNVSLLCGFFFLLFLANGSQPAEAELKADAPSNWPGVSLMIFLLAVSAAGMAVKLSHAMEIMAAPQSRATGEDIVQASLLYPIDYTTPSLYRKLTDGEAAGMKKSTFNVKTDRSFGELENVALTLDRPGWVMTNLVPFPWNTIYVDGRPVAAGDLRTRDWRLVFMAPAGNHIISAGFSPPTVWTLMRRIAVPLFFAWGAVSVASLFIFRKTANSLPAQSVHRV